MSKVIPKCAGNGGEKAAVRILHLYYHEMQTGYWSPGVQIRLSLIAFLFRLKPDMVGQGFDQK